MLPPERLNRTLSRWALTKFNTADLSCSSLRTDRDILNLCQGVGPDWEDGINEALREQPASSVHWAGVLQFPPRDDSQEPFTLWAPRLNTARTERAILRSGANGRRPIPSGRPSQPCTDILGLVPAQTAPPSPGSNSFPRRISVENQKGNTARSLENWR